MDYLSVVEMLNACHGPAGDERQIASTIQRLAEPYADDCWTDTMGNLIVHKKGSGPKVMFAAHMDSIGLIVTTLTRRGTSPSESWVGSGRRTFSTPPSGLKMGCVVWSRCVKM